MSYCMRCGKQTDNEDFVCDECRRKETAAGQDIPAQPSDGGAEAAANGRQGAEFQSVGREQSFNLPRIIARRRAGSRVRRRGSHIITVRTAAFQTRHGRRRMCRRNRSPRLTVHSCR